MGSVNYDQIHQTDACVIDNLSLDNFKQVDMHYTHLRSVLGSLDKKPAVWFGVEMARITKNASACCAASANFVHILHRTAFKHN